MATLEQLLARRKQSIFYYVIFGGVNKVFSNIRCPAKWETSPGSKTVSIGGETYAWSPTLMARRGQLEAQTRMVTKAGFVEPSNLELLFHVRGRRKDTSTDPWLQLITPPGQRVDLNRSKLQRTLSAVALSATATPTTNWPSSGVVHIGTEACKYSGTTSSAFTGLTRGAFRSHKQPHETLIGERFVAGSGPILADTPLAWEGRPVEVWMGLGTRRDHDWTPHAASPASSSDFQFHVGLTQDVDLVERTHVVRVSSVDIAQVRALPVLKRAPKATARQGGVRGINKGEEIIIDGYSNKLNFDWQPVGGASIANPNPQLDVQLEYDNGAGGAPVADGKYSRDLVEAYLSFTLTKILNAMVTSAWTSGSDFLAVEINVNSEGKARLRFTSNASTAGHEDRVFVIMPDQGSKHNLWRELGFEATQVMDATDNAATGDVYWDSPRAEKRVPAFRWPAHDPAITTYRKLYFTGDGLGLLLQAAPGFVDDDGNAIDGHALLGDNELISFDTRGTDGGSLYLNVTGRALAGTRGDEDIYIETAYRLADIEDLPEIKQVIAFPYTSPYVAELQMLHSGSGIPGTNGPWDKGWLGCALAQPAAYSDAASFLALAAQKGSAVRRPMILFTERKELRDSMRAEYIATQTVPVGQVSASGFKIACVEAAHPRLGDTTTQLIDASVLKSVRRGDLQIDTSHHKIINEAKVNTNWDPAKDKHRTKINAWDQTSRASYGEKQRIEFNLNSYHTGLEAEEAVRSITQHLWAQFGGPYHIIQLDVTRRAVWLWGLGSIVSLTHTAVPNLVNVGRGVETVLCRLVAYQHFYRTQEGDDAIAARLFLIPSAGRFPRYAPTAEVASKGSNTQFTITAQKYTHADSGRDDTAGFPDGSWVRFFKAGDEGSAETAQINSWSTYTVTLESPGVTLAATDLRIEMVDFDHANANDFQKNHAAMSVDGEIDSGVPAMEWS